MIKRETAKKNDQTISGMIKRNNLKCDQTYTAKKNDKIQQNYFRDDKMQNDKMQNCKETFFRDVLQFILNTRATTV